MKRKGEFVVREIAGDTLLIPVGETALSFNGMITLNDSGAKIWEGLESDLSYDEILASLLDTFEVDEAVAREDLDAFLKQLSDAGFLEL